MMHYDDRLQQLQEQMSRKKELEALVVVLHEQREMLSSRVWELGQQLDREQVDVDKLEGIGIAKIFYQVTGKLEEKLQKERMEASSARDAYDKAKRELAQVEEDLFRSKDELRLLFGCERKYETILAEKTRAVKEAGGEATAEIDRLEEKLLILNNQRRELMHALTICSDALDTVHEALLSLDSAEGWGTWDIVGGGLISTAIKHSHLDAAQGWMERLGEQLRSLKTELADVSVSMDTSPVKVDGFLRFSDYFLEGVLADWMVLDRINQSQYQVSRTKTELESIRQRLTHAIEQVDRESDRIQGMINQIVLEAGL